MDEEALPPGWALTAVENLAADERGAITDGPFGSNLKSDHYTEAGPRVIRLQNIGDGTFLNAEAHISEEHFESLRKHEARADDVVIAMLGEQLPRACLVPATLGPAIVKADCVRLRVHPKIALPSYVMPGLNSRTLRSQSAELMHGVGRPRLGLLWFRGLQFPLAPLPEQHRIVEAIESYFTRLDDAVATLERVERNLKRYRASVLKSAVEGRLVPTEAALAEQEGRDYEPASVLLERILVERRRRRAESGKKGDQDPSPPDTAGLRDLPDGWCWATVEQLGEAITGTTPTTTRADYYGGKLPFLKPTDLNAGYAVTEAREFLSDEGARHARVLPKGSVLVTCIGATIGKTGLARIECSTNQQINALVPDPLLRDVYFLYWFFTSPSGQTGVIENASSTTLPILNKSRFERLVVPVPPHHEQIRIVAELERVMSLTDGAEAEAKRTTLKCKRLRQSILKSAFEGKLADQDPTDEPASVLLERIKSEREATKPVKPSRPLRTAAKKRARA
jgi:type I restriction enzyme S subunit